MVKSTPLDKIKSRIKSFNEDEMRVWEKNVKLVTTTNLTIPEDVAMELTYRDLKIKELKEQVEKYKAKLANTRITKPKLPDKINHCLSGNLTSTFLRKFISIKTNLVIMNGLKDDLLGWHLASVNLFGKNKCQTQYLIGAYSEAKNNIEFYSLTCLSSQGKNGYQVIIILQDEKGNLINEMTLLHNNPKDFSVSTGINTVFKDVDFDGRKIAYCRATGISIGKSLSIDALAKRCLIVK